MTRQVIIYIILSSIISCGQQDNYNSKLNSVLASKKYSDFLVFFNNISRRHNPDIFSKYEFTRDITEDYRESQFFAEYFADSSKSHQNSVLVDLRINLIVHGDKIIYYNYEEIYSLIDTVVSEWKAIRTFKDSLRETTSMNLLNKAYERNFNAAINENDLFNPLVYGKACGIGGDAPNHGKLMEEFILNKDKASLLEWLKSTITEKQIYAVEGLYRLNKDSVSLTSEEIRIIKNVISKKGQIMTCNGCDTENRDIADIVKDWTF
jgi:hypothetical protein